MRQTIPATGAPNCYSHLYTCSQVIWPSTQAVLDMSARSHLHAAAVAIACVGPAADVLMLISTAALTGRTGAACGPHSMRSCSLSLSADAASAMSRPCVAGLGNVWCGDWLLWGLLRPLPPRVVGADPQSHQAAGRPALRQLPGRAHHPAHAGERGAQRALPCSVCRC